MKHLHSCSQLFGKIPCLGWQAVCIHCPWSCPMPAQVGQTESLGNWQEAL